MNVPLSLFPDLVVRKQLPLVDHDLLDPRIAMLQAIFLVGAHLEDACLPEQHIRFDVQLLEVIQVLG